MSKKDERGHKRGALEKCRAFLSLGVLLPRGKVAIAASSTTRYNSADERGKS